MKFAVDLNKGVLGAPDSTALWTEILSNIPDSTLLKPDVKILCLACGHGTEAMILAKRMLALGISKEAVNDSIWLLDKYQQFTSHAKIALGFMNVITADFLEWKTDMKFDVVVGNPPFQDGVRKDQANKLWPLFLKRADELLATGGYSAMITPNSWMQPTADIGKGSGKNAVSIFNDIFKKRNLIIANVNSDALRDMYFKGIGSTFSYVVYQNATYIGQTKLLTASGPVNIDINSILALPKIASAESITISQKMRGVPFGFYDQNHNLNGCESATKDKQFKHKIYHTNAAGGTYWFGEKKNIYAKSPKVVISLSGQYTTVFDNKYGFSNMCIALLCDSDVSAEMARIILNSNLYRFWVEMQKFSGFNPRKLLLSLPALPLNKSWTDNAIYKHFKLTPEEIAYVEANVK